MSTDNAAETQQPLIAVEAQVDRGVRRARRYGRFAVPARMADEYSSELLRVMGKCAVFRAEHLYQSDSIEYWAACDHFRSLSEVEMVPEYIWYFTSEGDFWCQECAPNTANEPPAGSASITELG